MLNENEKLVSWDVVVLTTDGRKLHCIGDLGIDLPDAATSRIDAVLEEFCPCSWADDQD